MKPIRRVLLLFLLNAVLSGGLALAQTGAIRGVVTDESGGAVQGAAVKLTGSSGFVKETTSGARGLYEFRDVPFGTYTIEASAPDLVLPQSIQIHLTSDAQAVDLKLKVAPTRQQVNVNENGGPTLSTEASANASATVLRGSDLDALADDPEDLATDLQALAGPSAGPSGGSMYIDGFSGGQLPSKDSIREIRINQNPFSPEYDKLGFGRIEVFTKPGGAKFHGSAHYNFGDSFWNSRNPYAAQKAPFQLQEYGGSLEGPLVRNKASFFLEVDGASIDNGAIIDATTLDTATLAVVNPYTQVFTIPQQRIRIGPRVDYQVTPSDTVSVRYVFANADIQHSGIGSFYLTSTGIHNRGHEQTLQVSNTKVLGGTAVNETRFQFDRAIITNTSDDSSAQVDVLNSFVGGGAQVGASSNALNSYELQNYTTISHNAHTLRFGVRVRAATLNNISPINFGGTFVFGGRLAPELDANNQPVLDSSGNEILVNISSIESYRRTLVFQQAGDSPSQIRSLGGGASEFSIEAGNPALDVSQTDIGAFIGDDWRAGRNVTLNFGLRYEGQTNIHDWRDFGPRLGLAWAPGRSANPKTVLRAGFGIFYQRFDLFSRLAAEHYNGIAQQQYVVTSPDFFPSIPPISSLAATAGSRQAIEKLSGGLSAPYVTETAAAVERELPRHTTVALTYVNSHGGRQFTTNDINAPLPGTYDPQVPGSGAYPLGTSNAVFLVQSSGVYNQNELIVNVNSRLTNGISLFGSYLYNRALSNTDYAPPPEDSDFNPAIGYGGIGVGSFPANPYSMAGEYGPASTDIHDQATFGGSIRTRGGMLFSPLLIADSGAPFNITAGQDLYGDTLFNGRPGIAVDTTRPGLISSPYGLLDPNPTAGEAILPRNFGRGPGLILANLRIAKIFSFGPTGEGTASVGGRRSTGGPFESGGASSSAETNHLYNLTVSLAIRNVINRNNPGPIIGNITSPFFGRANQPYGATALGGTGFSESADNRRLEMQIRLSF